MANLPKKKILDTEGNEVLPITHISAVYDDNGTSVETLLTNMDEEIKNKIIEGYYINGSFYTAPPITHDYVEIGGTKWATMNIGANSVTDYGLYFQWGDISGYTTNQVGSGSGQKYFGWPDYKYGNGEDIDSGSGSGSGGQITKYNDIDNKLALDIEDDAVTAAWSGNWRMPTREEFTVLGNTVNTVWTADYQGSGISGLICTDETDSTKTLFFPAAGCCYNGSVSDVGSFGRYWSSSLYINSVTEAFVMTFNDYSRFPNWNNDYDRSYGFSVRGIYDGPTSTLIIPTTKAIYIDKTTNTQYRWDGTAYAQLTKITYTTIDDGVEDADETIISQALRKTSQSLTSSEKAQVLTNLGISDQISGSLQKTAQVLSSAEKTQVLTNLGISSAKNITISTSEPTSSDGNNGDIWLVYEAQ